ncbi:MAG: PspA/IM30 family protein [Cellvibrionaceae bacterium]
MNVIQKLTTLVRGSARQSAQAIVDANALTVFEQEIVDVEKTVHQRKNIMSEMIVARKQIEEEISSLEQLIDKREQQALKLIDAQREESLVEEIANDIAQHETLLHSLRSQYKTVQAKIEAMGQTLRQALADITRHRRELRLAKAQHIRSSTLASSSHLPEQLSELESTRDQVTTLQSEAIAQEDAWPEISAHLDKHNIDKKIESEGFSPQQLRAKEILEELKRR